MKAGVLVGMGLVLAGLGIAAPPTGASGVQYSYDASKRLVEARYDDGSRIAYNYDAAGNRTTVVVTAAPACPGDLDGDGDVDGSDLAALAADPARVGVAPFAEDYGGTGCTAF